MGGPWAKDSTDLELLAIVIRTDGPNSIWQHENIPIRVICGCTGNSYTMGCPPVRGDNPRALASGLSYVQVDKHGITILYHLHQCRPCSW